MADHYLNVLTVHLRTYAGGHPVVGSLVEEMVLQVAVGATVDVEQLANELREDVGSGPRRIQQSITETSWGASGSGAELLIDIPAVLTGLASLPVLWDAVSRRVLRHGQARVLNPQQQAESAQRWLAQSLNLGSDEIKIVGLEPLEDGHRVELETPAEIFDVEVNSNGVTQMHRRQSRARPTSVSEP
jgi:hypothetical protein